MHTCDPNMWEVEAWHSGQGQPQLHSELKSCLGYETKWNWRLAITHWCLSCEQVQDTHLISKYSYNGLIECPFLTLPNYIPSGKETPWLWSDSKWGLGLVNLTPSPHVPFFFWDFKYIIFPFPFLFPNFPIYPSFLSNSWSLFHQLLQTYMYMHTYVLACIILILLVCMCVFSQPVQHKPQLLF